MHILLAYASIHGSSAEVADYMGRILRQSGLTATVADIGAIKDLTPYDAVVLGAPIHGGIWVKPMMLFVQQHQAVLRQKLAATWLTCIRVLEENGTQHVRQHYILPDFTTYSLLIPMGIFAGKLDLKSVSYEEQWLLNARYDGERVVDHLKGDFRDWGAIHQWTMSLVNTFIQQGYHQQV
jgi:menaquinone-dependent protoporphyrinogen oxidase